MPLLFSLGQHGALVAVQSQLRADDKLVAFLDDVYVVCKPDRVGEVYKVLEVELRTRACINIHKGKTKLWNAAGVEPTMSKELTEAARDFNPQAVVWRGDPGLPPCQQRLTVLGAPVGNEAFNQQTNQPQPQPSTLSSLPPSSPPPPPPHTLSCGVDFLGPCTQVQGRGSCPQGHSPHN